MMVSCICRDLRALAAIHYSIYVQCLRRHKAQKQQRNAWCWSRHHRKAIQQRILHWATRGSTGSKGHHQMIVNGHSCTLVTSLDILGLAPTTIDTFSKVVGRHFRSNRRLGDANHCYFFSLSYCPRSKRSAKL